MMHRKCRLCCSKHRETKFEKTVTSWMVFQGKLLNREMAEISAMTITIDRIKQRHLQGIMPLAVNNVYL